MRDLIYPALFHEGSAKNLRKDGNDLFFEFTDRYSLFDWGEMPDHFVGKSESVLEMTLAVYQALEKELGIKHHGIDRVGQLWKVHPFQVKAPSFFNGEYSYESYNKEMEDFIFPFEVIFRRGLPAGSSFLKRAKEEGFLSELGLKKEEVYEGVIFDHPIIELTTKYEPKDRFVSYGQAQKLGKASEKEMEHLIKTTQKMAVFLAEKMEKVGITLWDGKFEFAFGKRQKNGERELILVDSLGPDEIRLSYKGIELSKEVLRKWYRKSHWYQKVSELNKLNHGVLESGWQEKMEQEGFAPAKAPEELIHCVSEVYCSVSAVVKRAMNDDLVGDEKRILDEVIRKMKENLQKVGM